MKRPSHLTATFVALLAVGSMIAGAQPHGTALAGDPLSEAKAKQQQIEQALSQQRSKLAALKSDAAALDAALTLAESRLSSVSAQYDQVAGDLAKVQQDISDTQAQLDSLNAQIAQLDAQLTQVAIEISQQTADLNARIALLQEHLRNAYEQSQTSLLEVLLSARTLDDAANQVGYLMTIGDQDQALAATIASIRSQLQVEQQTLSDGRAQLADAQTEAVAQKVVLDGKRKGLAALQVKLAALKKRYEAQRAQQAAALNAALSAQSNVQQQIAANEAAAKAQAALVKKLQDEARRASMVSAGGFRWPLNSFVITQYFGPTSFVLEPPYTYNGVYYVHFHTGIDIASGCGDAIYASATGVVVASGQPLWPWDSAYGVIIDHGAGIQTWYWHMQARVIVHPGQVVSRGQLIGYEGATGFATGCHVHFAFNVNGAWRNPLAYLP
jgi:murein DD-endopeptidase MepM/ murein hydrolase activator NlpD